MNNTLSKPGTSLGRQMLLLLCSILLITLFYQPPASKKWFQDHVIDLWDDCRFQFTETIPEEEKKGEYYGESYLICTTVAKHLAAINMPDATILLEPNEYLMKLVGFKMPEPVIFYYFTNGVPCVNTNSPDVQKARFLLIMQKDGRFGLRKISTPAELQEILNRYKDYKNI